MVLVVSNKIGKRTYAVEIKGVMDWPEQQERDMIKNQWCKDNNIPLIRIPYTHLDKLTIEDLKLETTTFLVE